MVEWTIGLINNWSNEQMVVWTKDPLDIKFNDNTVDRTIARNDKRSNGQMVE